MVWYKKSQNIRHVVHSATDTCTLYYDMQDNANLGDILNS